MKKIDVLDRFPQGFSESDINTEALAAFCFPNGLKIRLIPRCAVEGAKKLGWLGVKGDTFQLQGVCDERTDIICLHTASQLLPKSCQLFFHYSLRMLLALSTMDAQLLRGKYSLTLMLATFRLRLFSRGRGEDPRL